MVDFDENSGDDLHSDYEHEEPNLTNMDDATAQLIDRVQKIEEWVDENPEHEEIRQWSRDILVATLYIENEYTYKSDALTQAEITNIELLSERQSSATASNSTPSVASDSSRNKEEQVKSIISRIAKEQGKGASIDRVAERAEQKGIERSEFDSVVESLRREGEIYEQSTDRFRTT
ncbi:hypothetical protein [Halococcus sp. IIIV-5B]|uniref:hypothetical protein n=1 Tax=Halococcus sp. IIIV-5B TaxID=2321230 RepID=UPI000E755E0D|nr:hypothetical protein [Halococcus sp. IIIV-5B]RJT07511.1 hypothetical protein D3261_02630 [Halococcus sp. IIIV-5B]